MQNEGKGDISNFLTELKQRKEEAMRLRQEEEDEEAGIDPKKKDNRKANDTKNQDANAASPAPRAGGKGVGRDGRPVPVWKPVIVLPSEKFAKQFVDKGETFKEQQHAFRTIPREHDHRTRLRMGPNDEFVGSAKFYPKFTQT